MRKLLAILLLPLSLFISCQEENSQFDTVFTVLDTVEFNLGYTPSTWNTFEYEDSIFFAFADFRTRKKISIFNEHGQNVRVVQVKDLMEEVGNRFISMASTSPDTIALLSPYVNQVYLIDRDANLLFHKDYSYLFDKNIEISSPLNYRQGKATIAVSYHEPDTNFNRKSKEEWVQFYESSKSFYNILVDTAFFQSVIPIMGMSNLYNRFVKKKHSALEGIHLLMSDSSNIFYSSYSDSLYCFDEMGDLNKVVAVKSEKNPAKVPALTYDEIHADEQALRENWVSGSFIDRVLWDKYRNLYYVFLRHKMLGDFLPFSILVYNENFDKLSEIKMPHDEFFSSALVGKRGLYLLNKTEDRSKAREYSILRYE